MTREEAIQKMMEGEKVTHPTLLPGQYLYVEDGWIWDENGFDVGKVSDPMFGEQFNEWDNNWTIHKEEKEEVCLNS